jgi:ketosteroid isomerase-like protein
MDEVRGALEWFIDAFEKLNLEDMMELFTVDATSFFPVEHHPTRLMGRDQIQLGFQRVIEKVKTAGLTRLSMTVEDLDIREYGDVAVATFHIRDNMLSRRTLVLRRTEGIWLITHLHASNAPLGAEI